MINKQLAVGVQLDSRRRFIVGVSAAAIWFALPGTASEIVSPENDTFLILTEGGEPGNFLVGVRTSVKADQALVEVFYEHHDPVYGKLLLSKRSLAPVVGLNGYGATRDDFTIPRDKVQYIEVTFLNVVGKRHLNK